MMGWLENMRKVQRKKNHRWGSVVGIKRLIGRNFTNNHVQEFLKRVPYTVENSESNTPLIKIVNNARTITKTPQEVCTMILQKLKNDTETKLGEPINKAVITVPAYFDISQRMATLSAATNAGFTVLKLLNEPTAAALSYYIQKKEEERQDKESNHSYCLVYDLGGGTFDVSILKKTEENIDVQCVKGDTQLGGHDFDNALVDYVSNILKTLHNCDVKSDKDNLGRLYNICESAKRSLSTLQETEISLWGFSETQNLIEITLKREKLEELIDNLLRKTITIVDECVKDSNVPKHSIQTVLLCGGSTRIPKIETLLSEYFNKKAVSRLINPDESVAEGAALHAAMLSKSPHQKLSGIQMKDVVSLSLGISTVGNKMKFIVKNNAKIPTTASSTFFTTKNNQTSMSFNIFEGERADARKNRFLHKITITGITPAPPGQRGVEVEMTVDDSGILKVKAKEKKGSCENELQVNFTGGIRSDDEIKLNLGDAQKNKDEDDQFCTFVDFKVHVLSYCAAVMYNLENLKLTDTYKDIFHLCNNLKEFSEYIDVEEADEFKKMWAEVEQQCDPVVKKEKFKYMPKLL